MRESGTESEWFQVKIGLRQLLFAGGPALVVDSKEKSDSLVG